jgi:hypothetical protein
LGGSNYHNPRQTYWTGEESGRWFYDPVTGDRCYNNSGMSSRQFRIMQRASGGDPRFFHRMCPQNDSGVLIRIPGRPQYDPGYDPGYYPENDYPRPPRTDGSYEPNRGEPSGWSGSPESPHTGHGPHGSGEWEYDPRREEMVRGRNKEPRPYDRTVRGARRGNDSPTDPEAFRRLQQVTRSLEGRMITEFDPTVPSDPGCARALSFAIENTYNVPLKNDSTAELERSLPQMGYVQIPWEERRAGDVMIAHREEGKKSHGTIYMGQGQIFNNSSPKGYMTTESEAKLYNPEYRYIVVYRKVR